MSTRWLLLTLLCVVLIAASYFCYQALGTDLLPEMDEGGFILVVDEPIQQFAIARFVAGRAGDLAEVAKNVFQW